VKAKIIGSLLLAASAIGCGTVQVPVTTFENGWTCDVRYREPESIFSGASPRLELFFERVSSGNPVPERIEACLVQKSGVRVSCSRAERGPEIGSCSWTRSVFYLYPQREIHSSDLSRIVLSIDGVEQSFPVP
jgi:hypothetical protein